MKYIQYFDKKRKAKLWKFDVTIAGHRYRHGGFSHKRDAEAAAAALHLLAQQLRYGLPTEVHDYTLDDLQAKLKADSGVPVRVCRVLDKFVELIGAQTVIRQLSRADIKQWADELRQKDGLSDSTFVWYLNRLHAALNRAGDYFAELETWRPPKFPKRPAESRRTRTVTQAEIAAFLPVIEQEEPWRWERPGLRRARKDLAVIIRLMILTGARREELITLHARSIDFNEKSLNLRSGKTKTEHTIPLSDGAIEVLRARRADHPQKLFPHALRTEVVHHVMMRAAEMVGMSYGQAEAWTLHDLRRTAATIVETAGVPYSAVSALLGHKRRDITARYTVAQMAEMRTAVNALEKWCRDVVGFFGVAGVLQSTPATSQESEAA